MSREFDQQYRIGLVGARGYVGRELLRLIRLHPALSLAFASSRHLRGTAIRELLPEWETDDLIVDFSPADAAAREPDAIVLALPNGAAGDYAQQLDALGTQAVLLDLSIDHRADESWIYGLPEIYGECLANARLISNPGCYATASVLALWPLRDLLVSTPHCFGVSGYSGAGTNPSPRNDQQRLRDNVLPYHVAAHGHQHEISQAIGRAVRLCPTVAPFFRGLVIVASCEVEQECSPSQLEEVFRHSYDQCEFVTVTGADPPTPRDVADTCGALIGGFDVDPRDPHRIGVVCAVDNLLKGAASQAIQNLSLALGVPCRRSYFE